MSLKPLFLAFSLLVFGACKLQRVDDKKESPNVDGYRIGDPIRTERFLNTTEKSVGSRICRDLRAKRNRWEVNRSGVRFNYDVRSRSQCSGGLASYEIQADVELASGDLVLDANTGSRYINEVLTDNHVALANICDELIAGEADVENTIEMGGSRYQVTFYEIGANHYTLITRFLQVSGTWIASLIDESFVVVQERTSSSDLVGVVYRRAQEARCSGGGSTYTDQKIR